MKKIDEEKLEELNGQLFEKLAEDLREYKENLLKSPRITILEARYELTLREDIVFCMEELTLPFEQAAALLRLKHPLDFISNGWPVGETNHMDFIQRLIETRAADARTLVERHESQKGGKSHAIHFAGKRSKSKTAGSLHLSPKL